MRGQSLFFLTRPPPPEKKWSTKKNLWYGGYGGSDSWRFSSGITEVVEHNKHYEVHNDSGSVYICHKGSKGMSAYTGVVFTNLKKQLEAKKLGKLKIVNRIKLNQFKQGEVNE